MTLRPGDIVVAAVGVVGQAGDELIGIAELVQPAGGEHREEGVLRVRLRAHVGEITDRGRRLLRTHLFQEARELGILTPEEFIGQSAPAEVAEAPIPLEAYRAGATGRGRR